ncbi:poxvirus late transcription factor VLTF3 like-domain-containing protein [Blyttiomyces helicus]|uniref:Poxvirus late transcription factor VLTF3 like-domain-containing protein n=1 Tax=Blyttiomyces helicus TaxID=388810 RepID=A0A4V1ISR1_9FUNG|nr:poxvirus late transcription factor VLTF3 like-domain-containing protein [Blyttiomyces helicus]|eukprot:RKO94437.1 poxvirus late transcription factor VLTF3 like-domain-containing protein [Blyttiomyces helicus]
MSNKIAVHGNKPKKTKSSPSHGSDVLWMHDTKMKYFEHLQNQVLPEKRKKLEKLIARGSGLNDALKKSLNKKEISDLEFEIRSLESREEEVDYLSKTHQTVNNNCKADTYTNQGVSYNDFQDTTYKSPFSYKRINRFLEILATLQAKENTDIPEFVMNAVQKEISKEQRSDLENINTDRIKYYLKRLSLTNFYEHAPRILMRVNGVTAIQIPTEVEEKLKEMFKSIQDPFEIVKEKNIKIVLLF